MYMYTCIVKILFGVLLKSALLSDLNLVSSINNKQLNLSVLYGLSVYCKCP